MGKQLPRSRSIIHWLIAISVVFLFISSWWMLSLPLPSENFTYRQLPFQLHKNIGITVLVFVFCMLAFKIFDKEPPVQSNKTRLQKLASLDHLLTYLLLVVSCISGYLSSSYSGWETTLWWLVDLPSWSEENDDLNVLFSNIHLWTCWALLAVVALHVSAALYHAFKNDGIVDKMFRL